MLEGGKNDIKRDFYLVTVAIGTSYQLPKISVPKKVRGIKQNKNNKWRKQRIFAQTYKPSHYLI